MATTIQVQGQTLTLSQDQDAALAACLQTLTESRTAVLAGAAGTGKTTVMAAVLAAWDGGVMFLAPTGKAAVRLAEQTGRGARTIHSAIFGSVEEEADNAAHQGHGRRRERLRFGELRAPEGLTPSTLVVVDEASMVNVELAAQLQEVVTRAQASLLWVGDHEQLPPVEGKWGVDLANPTARLDRVHRQALESPVLELATCVRERRPKEFTRWEGDVTRQQGTVEQAVGWAEGGDDRVLLTWTNKVRKAANRLTRQGRGYPRGEVQVGETLICMYNAHSLGIMNGETFAVESVEPHEELSEALDTPVVWVKPVDRSARFLVVPATFDAYHPRKTDRKLFRDVWGPIWGRNAEGQKDDAGLRALMGRMGWAWGDLRRIRDESSERSVQATWGYCLTVHKSQGSQWGGVGFISCPGFRTPHANGGRLTPDDKRRMTYTAITRAVEGFHAFMIQTVPDFRRAQPEAPREPEPQPDPVRAAPEQRRAPEPPQEPLPTESVAIADMGEAFEFALAGRAMFSLKHRETGRHHTYKVSRAPARVNGDPDPLLWFVGNLTGPDNGSDYTYLGIISARGNDDVPVFRTTAKTRNPASTPVRAFAEAFRSIASKGDGDWELFHAGRCGRCNRTLTDPESITRGIGPVCAAKEQA